MCHPKIVKLILKMLAVGTHPSDMPKSIESSTRELGTEVTLEEILSASY